MKNNEKQTKTEKWTPQQAEAINSQSPRVLVAAGAGTGKTRVLVERILKKITSKEKALSIDELLIVTFTNAAAAEMKARIGSSLSKAIKDNPSSTYLRRQFLLLDKANISTIHSFCTKVLRRYYYLVGLDPSFRVLDETEAELLRQEAVEKVLEKNYEEQGLNSDFYRLVEIYSSDRGDMPLVDLVLRLYNFSRSHPWPSSWFSEMSDYFDYSSVKELEESSWLQSLKEYCFLKLDGITSLANQALSLATKTDGPTPYHETIQAELIAFEEIKILATDSWQDLADAFMQVSFKRLPPCKSEEYDEALKKEASNLRNKYKDDFNSLADDLFSRDLAEHLRELNELAPLVRALVSLVEEFAEEYSKLKAEKTTYDFSDLEHYTLQVLEDQAVESGTLVPSEAAFDFKKQFKEILVDEYQDINMVQESIIQLITGSKDSSLFMVGDVKQSIYRFRLAEPWLFLDKYNKYQQEREAGQSIHLSQNFRSRKQVLAGVNFLFRQLMDVQVGEITYDSAAELASGALYPSEKNEENYPVELTMITEEGAEIVPDNSYDNNSEDKEEELEKAELEGRYIATKINEITKDSSFSLYDKERKEKRSVQYRDIVVLLRSAQNWAPAIMSELQAAGIPAYAELGSGYFAATEIEIMLSLLKVIDNPLQDIPLAAVLRSPIVGLEAEEMAKVRTEGGKGSYFEAVKKYAIYLEPLERFLESLKRWEKSSRQGDLSALIWDIYRETGYYDLVGTLPAGQQRQANLKALYDRARQYEKTSFRGLFRFLRFIETLQDKGGDLGLARALGEKENVVRIITIHKSKGLEFPVVFVAGLAKQFNIQDLNRDFLLHKQLGFGPMFYDKENRVKYPTLAQKAIKEKMRLELLAEEMRILYVALTRAEEKLFLVFTVKEIEKEIRKWTLAINNEALLLLPYQRAAAKCCLDWIGPTMLRHSAGKDLRENIAIKESTFLQDDSQWQINIIERKDIKAPVLKEQDKDNSEERQEYLDCLDKMLPVDMVSGYEKEIDLRLKWQYPYQADTLQLAKTSVTELKRKDERVAQDYEYQDFNILRSFSEAEKPRFITGEIISSSQMGTVYHSIMQLLSLDKVNSVVEIKEQVKAMKDKGFFTETELERINYHKILKFFISTLGKRLLRASKIYREVPFTMALGPQDIEKLLPKAGVGKAEQPVLLQGVIDCVFREGENLILIDYKSDSYRNQSKEDLAKKYKLQLDLYEHALEKIWRRKVSERFLYFINLEKIVRID